MTPAAFYDVEQQPIPESFQETCTRYLNRAIYSIRHQIVPGFANSLNNPVAEQTTKYFWTASITSFALTAFYNENWIVNTASSACALALPKLKASPDVAAGLLGVHLVKGAYNLAMTAATGSLENSLGALYDAAAVIKYTSIVQALSKGE